MQQQLSTLVVLNKLNVGTAFVFNFLFRKTLGSLLLLLSYYYSMPIMSLLVFNVEFLTSWLMLSKQKEFDFKFIAYLYFQYRQELTTGVLHLYRGLPKLRRTGDACVRHWWRIQCVTSQVRPKCWLISIFLCREDACRPRWKRDPWLAY